MRYLLDTNVVLWAWGGDRRIRGEVRRILLSEEVFVSVISAWEVTVKIALGKLEVPGSFDDALERAGYARLPLTFEHVRHLDGLPRHHGDPFDRMLVAQALSESMTLLTGDSQLAAYPAQVQIVR